MPKEQRLELTPYSPDMQRVIEHTHGRLMSDFQERLDTHDGEYDTLKYKERLFTLFYLRQTPKVIKKTCWDSLRPMPQLLGRAAIGPPHRCGEPGSPAIVTT